MEALWISYNAAIRMLHLVAHESNTSSLYFAQDSVHVMVAYAAVFLIKARTVPILSFHPADLLQLLLSVPSTIRREIEMTILNSLRTAAHIFSYQAAPPNTGCALQSTFLANVVALVEKACERRIARNIHQHAPRPFPGQHSEAHERPMHTTEMLNQSSHEAQQQIIHNSNHQDAASGKFDDSSLTPDYQKFDFDDNEMWSNIFASAGFAIDEGTFLPDVRGYYGAS